MLAITSMAAGAERPIDYNRDIRPILSEHCYACHGPDQNKRKAGLRLDRRDDAFAKLESGEIAIVPRDNAKSELIRRITHSDEDERMPPAKSGKRLSQSRIDLLQRWIDAGAEWTGHWAYIKPLRPNLPELKNKSWPRNEIDHFVLARLEQEGLKPSPEADKSKLIRRASLDLTGLTPTVSEVEQFLLDNSSDAYDKLVDRLLKSPQYGERMAQFWLDLARFADSAGYHHDSHRDMWHWRDWVIDAFNKNMPFDQFTIEQLAGDLLPNPTREQLVATGFNRNEMTTAEGGADPNEYSVKYVVGRVDTTSRVWLGTSMACAECHDHKYDPITQKEFYEFFAYFNTIAENGLDREENPSPRLMLDTPEQRAKVDQMTKEIAALEVAHKTLLETPNPEQSAAQVDWERKLRQNAVTNWIPLAPTALSSRNGAELTMQEDLSVRVSGTNAAKEIYELTLRTELSDLTGVRIETLPDDNLPLKRAGRSEKGEFILTGIDLEIRRSSAEDPEPLDAPNLANWFSLGPFKAGSAKEAFDKSFGPENGVDLTKTYDDGKLKWIEHSDWADGEVRAITSDSTKGSVPENSASYLYRTIHVKSPRMAIISLGSEGGLQVWLNGRKRLTKNVTRAAAADQEQLVVRLAPGENKLLLKISNGSSASGFYFKLLPDVVREYTVELAAAAADYSEKDFSVQAILDGKAGTGWSVGGDDAQSAAPHYAYLRTHEPFGFEQGWEIKLRLKFESEKPNHVLGRFRIAVTSSEALPDFFALPDGIRAALIVDEDRRSSSQRLELQKHYRQSYVPEVQLLTQLLTTQRKAKDDLVRSIPTTMIMREMEKPRETFLLVRGNFQIKGDKVIPNAPQQIFPIVAEFPPNRLGLAKWLVHPDHPLVSRVTVNHFWQQYFGIGLVKTAEDFGSQGEWPTHPELLDWLASEFIRSGWNMRAFQRLIVTSATFRQSAQVAPENLQRDPDNRLLGRFPRLRLEAEAIRDVAMAVSGLLDTKVGGPSVYPYQPPGLWEAVAFENTRKYIQSSGTENYRRGLYTYWRRSIPYASFVAFDAPYRETCTVKRPRTNTPLQAMVLLNDPVYVEAARTFGQRILQEGGHSFQSRLEFAYRTCLSRPPTKAERTALERSFLDHLQTYERDRVAAAKLVHVGAKPPPIDLDICELAAWTVIANTLLNLDETITKG